MDVLNQAWESGFLLPALVAVAALFFYFIANSVFRRIVKSVQSRVRESGIPFELLSMPFRLLAVLLLVSVTLPYLPLSELVAPVFRHAFTVVSIVVAVWFLMRYLLFWSSCSHPLCIRASQQRGFGPQSCNSCEPGPQNSQCISGCAGCCRRPDDF